MHENPVRSSIDTLQALEHWVHTAFGDSEEACTGDMDGPSQGSVQGCGAAPTGWVSTSSPSMEMMRKEGHGLDSWTALLNAVIQLACFAFVDNADLVNTLKDGNHDIEDLITDTQMALDQWVRGLRTSGADLNPAKSHWYLTDFKMNSKGDWKYKTIRECPGSSHLKTLHGDEVELERCEVNVGKKALGAKLRHDGVETDNANWFRNKASE